ncbi:MAG: YaiO family outer membrane beta-barrel protein [Gemmatimonadota bacterium]|nr:YaiO family outer membrane beta-barrel protein [Gemmatimonadota bacterium]
MLRTAMAVPLLAVGIPLALSAQAPMAGGFPGRSIEANALAQSVTNGYGDWSGVYVRAVQPGTRDTWYVDALALRAFGERGLQVGTTQRHDWTSRIFQMIGANVGSGAAIMPRGRVDGAVGLRLGATKAWQTTVGLSYVKSVTELSDMAGVASLAWYTPRAIVIDVGVRYNISRPGNVRSHRFTNTTMWTPSARRSFSLRLGGGTEGWQVIRTGTTLRQFHSQDAALSWREKVTTSLALSLQADWYQNPFYARSGVTLGVARYW